MPIYAYRCDTCGFEKDVLQKISDAPLTQCPSCGKDAFRKQVTAAGFQLKGSGWYVTDFRGGNNGNGGGKSAPATGAKSAENASSDGGGAAKSDSGGDSSAAAGSAKSDAPASTAASTASGS